jgi:GNAT superfamily N-acetyltransferase
MVGRDLGALRAGAVPLGAGTLFHANVDVLMFNMVLGLGVAAPATEAEVDEAVRLYSGHAAVRCMIAVPPWARPDELESWLTARGFAKHNSWLRLAREAATVEVPQTDLRVAMFGSERGLEFGQLLAEAFGHPTEIATLLAPSVRRPGWQHFGSFDGDRLVGAGALFIHGDAAWLGAAATAATHRGRGAQSALIATRVNAARKAGCRWIAVETAADTPEKPNPSTHNLRRLGFRDLYERPNWVKVLREG